MLRDLYVVEWGEKSVENADVRYLDDLAENDSVRCWAYDDWESPNNTVTGEMFLYHGKIPSADFHVKTYPSSVNF